MASECYTLPGLFPEGREAEELLMMARFVEHLTPTLIEDGMASSASLTAISEAVARGGKLSDLRHCSDLRSILGAYNMKRLREPDQRSWPRAALQQLADKVRPQTGMLPPPTPCEYVEDAVAWFGFGMYSRPDEWIGHGYFFRQRPDDHHEAIENAAGSAMNDFDLLEDGFVPLQHARVLGADYHLIRKDFCSLADASDRDIDEWLLRNCAYISAGQVKRLAPGGDHHELLGLQQGVEKFVQTCGPFKAGLRVRSGGRAATFVIDEKYSFESGRLCADFIDVKGIGTHVDADIRNEKVTGLLNFADALRELLFQRLIQRLSELAKEDWSTVKYYALLDTGLQYSQTNPATGWENERCVLLVRQPQSRLFDSYEGFNFSGVAPQQVLSTGLGKAMKDLIMRSGLSAEFIPTRDLDPEAQEESAWNLQVDAPCTHLMDFSDFYALPDAGLPSFWRMSEQAYIDSFALERQTAVDHLLRCPLLCNRLLGTHAQSEVLQRLEARRKELSESAKHREAAAAFEDDGRLIKRGKPKYCMCWFMELDDSAASTWALDEAKRITELLVGDDEVLDTTAIFAYIDCQLPTKTDELWQ